MNTVAKAKRMDNIKRGRVGVRAFLLDDLRRDREEYPRTMTRSVTTLLGGECKRAIFALHQAARLSEHFLHRARYGRDSYRRFLGEAEAIFIDVRRDILTLLKQWPEGTTPPRAPKASAIAAARRHIEAIKRLNEQFHRIKKIPCPCCLGRGSIADSTAVSRTAIKAVLDFAVKSGVLGFDSRHGYYAIPPKVSDDAEDLERIADEAGLEFPSKEPTVE